MPRRIPKMKRTNRNTRMVGINDRKSDLLDHSRRNYRLVFTQDHQGTGVWHVRGHLPGDLRRGHWRLDREKLFHVNSYSGGGGHGDDLALYPPSETYQPERWDNQAAAIPIALPQLWQNTPKMSCAPARRRTDVSGDGRIAAPNTQRSDNLRLVLSAGCARVYSRN